METSSFFGNACSSGSNSPRETWELFDSGELPWKNCTPADQESIVKRFAPKVKYLALRMKARLPRNVELSELISAGTLGLMESFGKFKPQMGIKFGTYAENRIRGAMLDELRRLDWFPRSLRRRVRTLDEAIHRLEHQSGASPTEEELAAATGMDIKGVREGLEALQNQFCLSLEMIQEYLSPSQDMRREEPFSCAAGKELIERVAELVEQLTPREKLVLSLYYTDDLNMRETAEVMGITEGRVSQLHSQALARLRKEFTRRHGEKPVL